MSRRLLLFITEDWFFWSHRLSLARAARAAGYEVALATRVSSYREAIAAEGITLFPLDRLNRSSANPLREAATLVELCGVLRKFRPDILHNVALKPVVYGSIAARLMQVPAVVNALGGLGFAMMSPRPVARTLRPITERLLRLALNGARNTVVVQNPGDRQLLIDRGIITPEHTELIRGSGVDIAQFVATVEPPGPPIVVLPARLLWDKGVGEFVVAARQLRAAGVVARFALVGQPDPHNPAAVPREQLDAWMREGAVEWWGLRQDMPTVLASAQVVCLPSYFEGLPKALLEAAACARPIVATDIAGCREIARAERNALIVPVKNATALAAALARLLGDPELRRRFGAEGRRIVEQEFADTLVAGQFLALYDRIVARGLPLARGDRRGASA